MTFKVPLNGYYHVRAEVVQFLPTGEFEEVANPKRRWWKFWLPKTIKREKFERKTILDQPEIAYLEKGQKVHLNKFIGRLGSSDPRVKK